ncbi:MAG: arsenate reductase (glutaredoxin) [Hyphomonadaceae bacterium]|nr:arsenate reductase (glutaredoxin) [Hyphomonadaceae bacterium]
MAKKFPIVIYHNPKCGTSRGVIEIVEAAGHKPEVIEYLKAGWTKAQLKTLFADAGITPREAMRANVPEAEELGLLDEKVSAAKIVDAMVAHPILVNRPFVVTPKGTKLCRPKETVRELL